MPFLWTKNVIRTRQDDATTVFDAGSEVSRDAQRGLFTADAMPGTPGEESAQEDRPPAPAPDPEQWIVRALLGVQLGLLELLVVVPGADMPGTGGDSPSSPRLLRDPAAESSDTGWILCAGADATVTINGEPSFGIRVLEDRDEITLSADGQAHTLYYSTERQAAIVPFDGPAGSMCPRCLRLIETGQPAVACPGCGMWYHEHDAETTPDSAADEAAAGQDPCWSSVGHCQHCKHPTPLDAELNWTPARL